MKEIVVDSKVTKAIITNRAQGISTLIIYYPTTGQIKAVAQKIGNYPPPGAVTVVWRYGNHDEITTDAVKQLIEESMPKKNRRLP